MPVDQLPSLPPTPIRYEESNGGLNDASRAHLRSKSCSKDCFSRCTCWIFAIALLVFGPSKLPELGKGIGQGIRSFKSAISAEDEK